MYPGKGELLDKYSYYLYDSVYVPKEAHRFSEFLYEPSV
jgi:hypothetical protein